jgi:hypothetical protein
MVKDDVALIPPHSGLDFVGADETALAFWADDVKPDFGDGARCRIIFLPGTACGRA